MLKFLNVKLYEVVASLDSSFNSAYNEDYFGVLRANLADIGNI